LLQYLGSVRFLDIIGISASFWDGDIIPRPDKSMSGR